MRPKPLVTLVILALMAACSGVEDAAPVHRPGHEKPVERPAPEPHIPTGKVVLSPEGKPPATVAVEVVSTPERIHRGLMFRRSLAADAGMLFMLPEERIQTFWMKNTLLSLDMIFITSDMTVAGVVENTKPLSTDTCKVDTPSHYVLEVNAGWARAHGITAGAKVTFENVR
ncbi:MAG TPA: DUF192 domain-containing protein [Kofleriaceae bacterium]|nr:DUF192 domain-containing protein [Kofleriaceae bacterium]